MYLLVAAKEVVAYRSDSWDHKAQRGINEFAMIFCGIVWPLGYCVYIFCNVFKPSPLPQPQSFRKGEIR